MAQDYKITWFGKQFFDEATKHNVKAMKKATFMVEREVKKSFGTGASRMDVKTKRGKNSFHRPSAPGFVPNIDNGMLKNSIASKIRHRASQISGFVGVLNPMKPTKKATAAGIRTNVQYGLYLELGTKNMAPRPFLRPALRKLNRKILRLFKKENS